MLPGSSEVKPEPISQLKEKLKAIGKEAKDKDKAYEEVTRFFYEEIKDKHEELKALVSDESVEPKTVGEFFARTISCKASANLLSVASKRTNDIFFEDLRARQPQQRVFMFCYLPRAVAQNRFEELAEDNQKVLLHAAIQLFQDGGEMRAQVRISLLEHLQLFFQNLTPENQLKLLDLLTPKFFLARNNHNRARLISVAADNLDVQKQILATLQAALIREQSRQQSLSVALAARTLETKSEQKTLEMPEEKAIVALKQQISELQRNITDQVNFIREKWFNPLSEEDQRFVLLRPELTSLAKGMLILGLTPDQQKQHLKQMSASLEEKCMSAIRLQVLSELSFLSWITSNSNLALNILGGHLPPPPLLPHVDIFRKKRFLQSLSGEDLGVLLGNVCVDEHGNLDLFYEVEEIFSNITNQEKKVVALVTLIKNQKIGLATEILFGMGKLARFLQTFNAIITTLYPGIPIPWPSHFSAASETLMRNVIVAYPDSARLLLAETIGRNYKTDHIKQLFKAAFFHRGFHTMLSLLEQNAIAIHAEPFSRFKGPLFTSFNDFGVDQESLIATLKINPRGARTFFGMMSRALQAEVMLLLCNKLNIQTPDPALKQLQTDFFNIVLTNWIARLELLNYRFLDCQQKFNLIVSLHDANPERGKDEIAKLFCGKPVLCNAYLVFSFLCVFGNPELAAHVVAKNGVVGIGLLDKFIRVKKRGEEKERTEEKARSEASPPKSYERVLKSLKDKYSDFYRKLPENLKLEEDRMATHVRRPQDSSDLTTPLLASPSIQYNTF